MREDYIAELDPYARLLPNRLRVRYRLNYMDATAALAAVTKPAELGGRPFEPGVAERLVDNLRQRVEAIFDKASKKAVADVEAAMADVTAAQGRVTAANGDTAV